MSAKGPGFSVDLGTGEDLEVSGWDALETDVVEDQKKATFDDQLDQASMYRQCFSTPAGRHVLADFIHMFLMADIVLEGDEAGSLTPGIRQGQANVVKRCLYMIEFANTGGGKPTGTGVQTEE